MAIGPLTITSQRENVIDFSKPFQTVGISLVTSRKEEATTLFQIIEPLTSVVWCMLAGVLVLVSATLFVIDRVAPAHDEGVRFNSHESLWFTFASMALRTSELVPRTVSGRLLAGALWFFSLFIISSYTANMASLLTLSRMDTPVRGVGDLIDQTKIKYGTVRNSHVSVFFENSKIEQYQRMWTYMSKVESSSMVNKSEDGFKKAKESEGKYVFMWDSAVVQYQTTQDCDLVKVGETFDLRGYGVGIPKGAPYRDDITQAILKLREDGKLQALEDK